MIFAVFSEFGQGLSFVQNPTKSTKRGLPSKSPRNPTESFESSNNMILDRSRRGGGEGAIVFAVFNEFGQGLRFVQNPTKSTKRRPPENRLEIA